MEVARPIYGLARAPSELLGRGRGRPVAALAAGGLAPAEAALVLADEGAAVLSEGLAPSVIALASVRGGALVAAAVLPEGLAPSEIVSAQVVEEAVSVLGYQPAREGWRPRKGPRVCGGPEFGPCPR